MAFPNILADEELHWIYYQGLSSNSVPTSIGRKLGVNSLLGEMIVSCIE